MLATVRAGRARAFDVVVEFFDDSSSAPWNSDAADLDGFRGGGISVTAVGVDEGGAALRWRVERGFFATGPVSSAEERGRTAGGWTANVVAG